METDGRILLVDDDSTALELLSELLLEKAYQVDTASHVDDALEKLKRFKYHALISDLKMPKKSGMDLLDYTLNALPELPVILLTAHGTIENAVTALKKGAFDYITKPVRVEELDIILDKATRHKKLLEQNLFLKHELWKRDDFLYQTGNPQMADIFNTVESLKSIHSTVLLQGESGTGKEVLARYIHAISHSRSGSFVPINCGAIPESLIESELFGYEKGAFTDAKSRTKGKLEIADGGTLFLDEISELPFKAQVALLRFLQEKEITPLGSPRRVFLNVRIITATNNNLKELVNRGKFREDLFYRINVFPLTLPPLRERGEDIIPLALWLLKKYAREYNKKVLSLSREAGQALRSYFWPGNIRELKNCIERAVILTRSEEIQKDLLFMEENQGGRSDFSKTGVISLRKLEKEYIHWVLGKSKGNKTLTAARLGISVRGLRYRLKNEENSE